MTRRALISTNELRRMARVVRDEGVTINARVDALGGLSLLMTPAKARLQDDSDELDAAMDRYLGK